MTADVELLPLPEADGFMESFDTYGCPVGTEDAWAEETVKAYARANVAHVTATKDAEIEALRAEVERLRAIAGCAYQMAGVHDAPEVWLDRLGQAANGDALPDPDTISDELLPYQPDAVCEAEARAERLAEALRPHIEDLERSAVVLDQYPAMAPTAAEMRKAAAELRAALEQESNDA